MDKISVGRLGEDLACEYLVGKSYKILERNYRKPWGELDIIAKDKNDVLVFVEVKALAENQAGGLSPEDNLTFSKLKKLQRTCRQYVAGNPEIVHDDKGWRIDLIAVKIPLAADIPNLKNCEISHYENI